MNKVSHLIIAFVCFSLLFLPLSCKKASDDTPVTPGADQGYEANEAAAIMTLAAITYTAEGSTSQTIKDSIMSLLGDPDLATGGKWELAWGPGISETNSNLVYVAKNTSTVPVSYAMAVRGTTIYSIADILQDVEVFSMVPFKYGLPGDSVARGSMEGLDILLETEDPKTGKTLAEFLPGIAKGDPAKMYITGHSQGGALAPLLAYWFIMKSGVTEHFLLETYAFAGPSVGNESFRANFFSSQPSTAYFHMVANSLDIVPYFWAHPDSVVIKKIPAPVPLAYRILLSVFEDYFQLNNIKYVQMADQVYIGSYPPTDTLGHIHPSDTLAWYNHWGMVEHRHNNYLRLFGVSPI